MKTIISFDRQSIFDALADAVKKKGHTPSGHVVVHSATNAKGELLDLWAEVEINEPVKPKFEGSVPRD